MTLPEQHRSAQICQDWQQSTEQAIEAGRAPLLEVGMDRQQLNSLPLLLTLATWSMSRTDLTQPLLLTGDVDALWPVPLFYTATRQSERHQPNSAPSVQIAYGGADRATYLASLTTHAAQRLQRGALYAVDLPVAMQPLLSMHTQPHANASWHLFPLTLLHRATVDHPIAEQATAANSTISNTAVSNSTASLSTVANSNSKSNEALATDDPWLAWATLVMIVALVLLAIFL